MIPAKIDSISISSIRQKGLDSIVDWFNQHKRPFYALGWFYLGNTLQMEELFYQTILKVQKELPRFKSDASFETWVTSIFIHTCRNLSKIKSPQDSEESEHDDFLKALNRLEESEREALVLSCVIGIPREKAAQILHVSAEQMKGLTFSGIRSLRKEMGYGLDFNGCKEYQKYYIDYLERTMDRPQKIEFEKHVYRCPSCQEDLGTFQEVMLYLLERMESIHVPAGFMEKIKKKLAEQENRKQQKNEHRTKVGLIIAGVFALLIGTCYFTGAFTYLYYQWTEENPQLRASLQHGIGESLDLEAKSNGVRIKIKGAIADDVQTLVYYEIEDMKEDSQYALTYDDGVLVENGYKILKNEQIPRYYPPDLESDLNNKEKNVYEGKLSLPPLSKDHGTINLKITKLMKLNRNPYSQINESTNEDMFYKTGKWNFAISVTKQPSTEYALNQKTKLEGITVQMDKLILSPTTTILQYHIVNNQEARQIHQVAFDSLEVNNKKAKPDIYGSSFMDSSQYDYTFQAHFDPLPGEKPKEVTVRFGSVSLSVNDEKTIQLDGADKYPQTFEYAGSTISIDKLDAGNPANIVISDHEIKHREYDSLNFHVVSEDENALLSMEMNDMQGVALDKNGKEYDPAKTPFFYSNEETRYLVTVQSLKVVNEDTSQKVIPKRLQIMGYTTTKFLDDVVKLSLKEGVQRQGDKE